MFDSPPAPAYDARGCADALVASVRTERRAVAERFALVAAWADLHAPAPTPARQRWTEAGQTQVGADGTPPVTRAGVLELGMLLGTSPGSARALLRDVLELRHRLPQHWAAVQELRVDGWKARQVAVATHRLTPAQAGAVDDQVLGAVTGLAWGPAKDVVEAKVIAADPTAHAARLAEEENRRFVSTRRRSTTAGLRMMITRGHAGDIARLEAIISHLAARMAAAGDTNHLDRRRAIALAMLANPALTCVFLAQTQPLVEMHTQTPPPATDQHAVDEVGTAQALVTAAAELLMTPEPDTTDPDHPARPAEPAGFPSAVELGVAFGRVLGTLGTRAVDRLRPTSVLYLHLAAETVTGHPGTGTVRVEDPLAGGPISTEQLRAWLRHDRISVRPVLDPTTATPVSSYEIPHHLREAVQLLNPLETFPWATLSSRQADLDHVDAYRPTTEGGPPDPAQTALTNLGPLGRTRHLAKTFDGFTVRQPTLGLYLWRSPTGHWFQVDHHGTRQLGRPPTRPAAVRTAERLPTTDLTVLESHFRDAVVRHVAA